MGIRADRKIGAAVLLAFGAGAIASPASAVSYSGTTRVAIITPLSLVNVDTLRFGWIVPSAAAGTVTVNPFTEARSATGGVTLAGGQVTAGKFTGLTEERSHLKIDVPTGSVTLTRQGGGATMLVDDFMINGDKNEWVSANTAFTFNVGARLNVGANQMVGTYSGTYGVTVNYR